MSWAINQDCRDSRGNILSDIINITKQHVENGPPPLELGVDGNIYTDALNGQQYQKQGGQWVLTVDLPAVSGGSQTLASGDGVNVLIDNPVPGTTTFTMGQSVSHLGSGIRVYDPLISGAGAVEARTIKNSDGLLSVSQAVDGAVSVDNNSLVESVSAGQGIAISNPPAPFENQKTIDNTGLLNVVDVGLPAYGSIASRSQPTGPADVEIKKFGAGSNIVLTNDANGVLVATSPNVSHNSVDITTGGSPANPALDIQGGPGSCGIHYSNPGGFSRMNFNLDGASPAHWFNGGNLVTEFPGGSNWVNTVSAVTSLGSGSQLFNNIFLQNAPVIGSDSRIKHDVQDIMSGMGLSFVKNLRPVSFVYNDTVTITEDGTEHRVPHSRRHLGFIAQEIQSNLAGHGCDTSQCDIIDNDIMKDPEGLDQWRLRTDSLVPCLVKAIQQLEARVAVLESK